VQPLRTWMPLRSMYSPRNNYAAARTPLCCYTAAEIVGPLRRSVALAAHLLTIRKSQVADAAIVGLLISGGDFRHARRR